MPYGEARGPTFDTPPKRTALRPQDKRWCGPRWRGFLRAGCRPEPCDCGLPFGPALRQCCYATEPVLPSGLRVRRGDKKRPHRQISKAYLHADPPRVLMPHQEIDPKPNQDCGDGVADSYER